MVNRSFPDDTTKVTDRLRVSSDPDGGTVAQGSLITIPSVGGDVGAAKTQLQSLGLNVKVHKRFGGFLGHLVDMNPSPGTQVHRGDTVTLYVI
jgi:beta-lactam-binding protein with PASTA domain